MLTFVAHMRVLLILYVTSFNTSRNDDWLSDRRQEEGRGYDVPAGMDDGTIESNWDM